MVNLISSRKRFNIYYNKVRFGKTILGTQIYIISTLWNIKRRFMKITIVFPCKWLQKMKEITNSKTDFELLLICVLNSIHFNTNSENHTPFPEKKLILLCLFVIIHCFSYQWFVVNIFYYHGFFGMHFFEFLIKQVTILIFF